MLWKPATHIMGPFQLNRLFSLHKRRYEVYSVTKAGALPKPENKAQARCGITFTLECRHVVALMGFAIFAFLGIHRMNMTVSIVAMVKQLPRENVSSESMSCPELEHRVSNVSSLENVSGEFDWSPEIQGYVLGSSFVGYFLTQLVAGKLSETLGCKWIIFCGVFWSSLSTLTTPFVSWWSFYALIVVQTLRGMAQGVFQASVSVLAANWFPAPERGCLFALVMSGNGAGVLLGGLVSGYLCQMSSAGWPAVFYACGAAGIIFALVIAIFLFENPSVHPRISEEELKFITRNQESKLSSKRPSPPWCSIFTSIPVYALAFAIFGQFWAGTHFLAVHPTFLGTILHFPIAENGLFASLPFLLQTVFTIVAGLISNVLNRKNYVSVSVARKFWNFIACLGYSGCLVGIYVAQCDRAASVAYSFLAMACLGFAYAGSLIVAADMTPTFAGSLMGIVSTAGSTSGFILPLIVGFLTDGKQTLEQWNKVIFVSVGVVMSSGISFCLFGSADVQNWNFVEERTQEDTKKSNDCEKFKKKMGLYQ